MYKKITPVLFMDSIEDSLPFWTETLGFEKTVAVPEAEGSEKHGFVILVGNGTEVMLQTWKSIDDDIGWKDRTAQSFLFIEVADIKAMEKRLQGLDKVVEKRETFYGATEIGVLDLVGNLVVFAEFKEQQK